VAGYSIWIVEYARVLEYPVSAALYGRHNEGSLVLPYCYGVVQGEGHTAVVDTGFDNTAFGKVLADTYGVSGWQPPDVVLPRIGIDRNSVDTVILTHNHFDHAGNVAAFPNAHVYIQQREISNFMWASGLPERLRWLTTACDPDLLLVLVQCLKEGRLSVLEGEAEPLPGVTVIPALDTHTAGSQYVRIENEHDGRWIMAGDEVYVFENFRGTDDDGRFVPPGLAFGSVAKCLLTMEDMFQFVEGEVERIMPFHEFKTWEQYPSREFPDGLHVAELSLRPGDESRLG
jgi:glyoxylase-like metal-dependent hydrolase (beta-lactamase superfamily II)